MRFSLGLALLGQSGAGALRLPPRPPPAHRAHAPIACARAPAALFPESLNLIYDGECGVCRWEVEHLRSLGAAGRVTFTDLEDAYDDDAPRNAGVSYARGMAAITAVRADGEVLTGLPAFEAAYEAVGFGWLFGLTKLPLVGRLLGAGYAAFARVRTNLTRGRALADLLAEHEAEGGG